MPKVVINVSHGNFGLNKRMAERLAELGNPIAIEELASDPEKLHAWTVCRDFCRDIARDDPDLVKVAEEFGEEMEEDTWSGPLLKVVEVPEGEPWKVIDFYDGKEKVLRTPATYWE